jgi:putative membrane protein
VIGHMSGWMWDGGWMWLWMVFMVLFWAALIVFGVWAVRRFTDRSSGSARRILEERFARGEIDADEFQRQRDLLGR